MQIIDHFSLLLLYELDFQKKVPSKQTIKKLFNVTFILSSTIYEKIFSSKVIIRNS